MRSVKNIVKEKISTLWKAGALHITLGTFATKFVAFFGSIVVVRLLTKEEYGVMTYVENIYSYAYLFAGLGLSNAVLRYLVIAKDSIEQQQYFNYIIKNSVIRDIILMLFLGLISQIIGFPDSYSSAKYLLPIIAMALPFQDLVSNDLFSIRAFFENKLYASLAFLSSVMLILGRVAGAYLGNVSEVFLSQVIINAAFSICCLRYIQKKFFCRGKNIALPKKKARRVNIYSLQYMITNGFWALFMLNDTFLLGLLLNDPDGLADYKVAYVLPGNISIFATAIGVFVSPYFIKNEKNKKWIRDKFKVIYPLTALIVGVVALTIGLLARPLITLMYGEKYINIVGLMRVLLVAAFFNSGLRYTTANLLASMGEIKYNMIVSAIGIGAQIVSDFIFIPRFGVVAVAISNCVVYAFMALILFIIFYKKFLMKGTTKI